MHKVTVFQVKQQSNAELEGTNLIKFSDNQSLSQVPWKVRVFSGLADNYNTSHLYYNRHSSSTSSSTCLHDYFGRIGYPLKGFYTVKYPFFI